MWRDITGFWYHLIWELSKKLQQGEYNMNFEIEKLPAFVLENKFVEQIRDLRVLGIYTFCKMLMEKGEYSVCVIIDKMKEQFFIEDKEMLDSLKIIIEDLILFIMIKQK